MSYDGKDGKLIDWHQRFIDWNNISPWVWYDKEGNQIKVIPKGNEKNITVYARWDKIISAK